MSNPRMQFSHTWQEIAKVKDDLSPYYFDRLDEHAQRQLLNRAVSVLHESQVLQHELDMHRRFVKATTFASGGAYKFTADQQHAAEAAGELRLYTDVGTGELRAVIDPKSKFA